MKTASGLFTTANFEPCQTRSFDNTVTHLGLWNQTPISGMLGWLGGSAELNTQMYAWGRTHMSNPFAVLGANLPIAQAGALTQIAISDDNMFIPSQVYEIPSTREQVLVINTTGNIAVLKRGVGTVSPQAAPAGTEMFFVGTANEEASFCPPGMAEGTSSLQNYMQIFRESWSMSGSAAAMDPALLYNPQTVARLKKEMMRRFMLGIERARIFGQREETVVNGKRLFKMDGIINMIYNYAPQNVIAAGATTTIADLEDMTDKLFDVTIEGALSTSKMAIGGTKAMRVINALGRTAGTTEYTNSETSFGMVFSKFVTRRGSINFMLHPMFDSHPLYENALMFLEPSSMEPVHLRGRQSLVYNTDHLANNCQDAMSGGVLAELGLRVKVPEANGIILGLTAAACTACLIPVTKYVACLMIDKPCVDGEVAPGTVVNISIHDAKPASTYVIMTPTGTANILTNASGAGTIAYTVTNEGTNAFQIAHNIAANFGETMWKHAAVSTCVAQKCGVTAAVPDSPCVDQIVSAVPAVVGTNTGASVGAAPGCC